jgi:hypothetical protein
VVLSAFSGALALAAIVRRNAVPIACAAFIVIPAVLRLAFGAPDGDLDATLRKVVIFRLDAIAYGVAAVWFCRHWPAVARRWKAVAIAVGIVLWVDLRGGAWPIAPGVARSDWLCSYRAPPHWDLPRQSWKCRFAGSASAPTRCTWST